MHIVIDIPEGMVKALEQGCFGAKYNIYDLCGCVMNGTPLPKGHKRLIEANEELFQSIRQYCGRKATCEVFVNAPTIIESDKEVDDADSN